MVNTPIFQNRSHAINYYKKCQRDIDQDLQDWLVHYEKLKADKILQTMTKLKQLQDLIDWNLEMRKKELPLTSFSRDSPNLGESLGLNNNVGGEE